MGPRGAGVAVEEAVAAEAAVTVVAEAAMPAPAGHRRGSRWYYCCRLVSSVSARTGVTACLEFCELTYAASCFPATDAEYTDFVYRTSAPVAPIYSSLNLTHNFLDSQDYKHVHQIITNSLNTKFVFDKYFDYPE